MTIKAIETRYKGYRFRSRLEARWAVFFDALGIRWEYEKEGFELPSGRYLPDFWLADQSLWVEIKPGVPTDLERRLLEELVWNGPGDGCILGGVPTIDEYGVIGCYSEHYERVDIDHEYALMIASDMEKDPDEYGGSEVVFRRLRLIRQHHCFVARLDPMTFGELFGPSRRDYEKATHAARSARFEHGESGESG